MKTELKKISVQIDINESLGTCIIPGNQKPIVQNPIFETYEDHRMAMALSMVAVTNSPIKIEEPEVVHKSFPGFWASLANCGFETSVSK